MFIAGAHTYGVATTAPTYDSNGGAQGRVTGLTFADVQTKGAERKAPAGGSADAWDFGSHFEARCLALSQGTAFVLRPIFSETLGGVPSIWVTASKLL